MGDKIRGQGLTECARCQRFYGVPSVLGEIHNLLLMRSDHRQLRGTEIEWQQLDGELEGFDFGFVSLAAGLSLRKRTLNV
jgi:hypothetical protein